MKLAVYVEGATSQFVLTPETEWEKKTVRDLSERLVNYDAFATTEKTIKARIMRGGFYECAGGWVREGNRDESLIVRFDTEEKKSSSYQSESGL